MKRIENIIEQIELDYLKFTGGSIEERKKTLPLTKPKQIKSLIWNLLTSEKWREKISYNDYKQIMDILLKRIENE